MKRLTAIIACAAVLCAQLASAQDAIDLRQAIIHNSPADVAAWPVAAQITHVALAQDGLSFWSEALRAWPDVVPPGWAGPLQYTVWACVQADGWHCAGFIQMWRGRAWTGAPLPAEWNANWAYDAHRWGPMADVVPKPGDAMVFFLTAGNARGTGGVTSVRERTNAVLVTLPSGGTGIFDFEAVAPHPAPVAPQPPVVVVAPPIQAPLAHVPPPTVLAADPAVLQQVAALQQQLAQVNAKLDALDVKFTAYANSPPWLQRFLTSRKGVALETALGIGLSCWMSKKC